MRTNHQHFTDEFRDRHVGLAGETHQDVVRLTGNLGVPGDCLFADDAAVAGAREGGLLHISNYLPGVIAAMAKTRNPPCYNLISHIGFSQGGSMSKEIDRAVNDLSVGDIKTLHDGAVFAAVRALIWCHPDRAAVRQQYDVLQAQVQAGLALSAGAAPPAVRTFQKHLTGALFDW